MEDRVLFIKNSVPLEEADEFIVGSEYFNKCGEGLKYLGDDKFIKTKDTPLVSGRQLLELKRIEALKLFWILSNKVNDDKDTD